MFHFCANKVVETPEGIGGCLRRVTTVLARNAVQRPIKTQNKRICHFCWIESMVPSAAGLSAAGSIQDYCCSSLTTGLKQRTPPPPSLQGGQKFIESFAEPHRLRAGGDLTSCSRTLQQGSYLCAAHVLLVEGQSASSLCCDSFQQHLH